MGDTAISALTTVDLTTSIGTAAPFVLTAIFLALYAIVAALVLRDAPGRAAPTEPLSRRLADTFRLSITWEAAALYAVAFGGYVAFSVYLPAYLRTAYHLSAADASNRIARFVLLAVIMRPLGGWLSDRFGAVRILAAGMSLIAIGVLAQSFTLSLMPLGTIALVARLAPANKVGAVTGVVGATGGLGGFVPPLIMGAVYGQFGNYAIGLAALAVVAAAALTFTATTVRRAVLARSI